MLGGPDLFLGMLMVCGCLPGKLPAPPQCNAMQVEAAKREIMRHSGARHAETEIWETQLVALQVRA